MLMSYCTQNNQVFSCTLFFSSVCGGGVLVPAFDAKFVCHRGAGWLGSSACTGLAPCPQGIPMLLAGLQAAAINARLSGTN